MLLCMTKFQDIFPESDKGQAGQEPGRTHHSRLSLSSWLSHLIKGYFYTKRFQSFSCAIWWVQNYSANVRLVVVCAGLQPQVAQLQNFCCKEGGEAHLRIAPGGTSPRRGCRSDIPVRSPAPLPALPGQASWGLEVDWILPFLPGEVADERHGDLRLPSCLPYLPLLPPGVVTAKAALGSGVTWIIMNSRPPPAFHDHQAKSQHIIKILLPVSLENRISHPASWYVPSR